MKKEFTEQDMLDAFNAGYDLGFKNLHKWFDSLLSSWERPSENTRYWPFEDLLKKKRT